MKYLIILTIPFLSGCFTVPKHAKSLPSLSELDNLPNVISPKISKSKKDEKSDYLKTQSFSYGPIQCRAGWRFESARRCSTRGEYTIPDGYLTYQVQTLVYEDKNGSYSTSYAEAGTDFIVEEDLKDVYDLAIKIAADAGEKKIKADLQKRYTEHESYRKKVKTNKNLIMLRGEARGYGNFFDRRSGKIKIGVMAESIYIGVDKDDVKEQIKTDFGIKFPKEEKKEPEESEE